jgi:hypothetical protein
MNYITSFGLYPGLTTVVNDHGTGSKNLPYTVNSFTRTISCEFFFSPKRLYFNSKNYKQLELEVVRLCENYPKIILFFRLKNYKLK